MPREITSGGEAVSSVNAGGTEIDGQAWRYTVNENGEARVLVVQVTGPAAAENREEVAQAVASRGRSVADELIATDEPLPRRVTLLTEGRRDIVR